MNSQTSSCHARIDNRLGRFSCFRSPIALGPATCSSLPTAPVLDWAQPFRRWRDTTSQPLLVTIAIGLGFAAVIDEFPRLFAFVKWAGSVYVLYLAWKFFRAGMTDEAGEARPAGFHGRRPPARSQPQGLYDHRADVHPVLGARALRGYTTAVLWISLVFTINNLIAFTAWALIGDQILARFRDAANFRKLNIAFGAMLAAVAIWMAFG